MNRPMNSPDNLIVNQFTNVTADDDWSTYLRYLDRLNIFSLCEGKTVLEFASNAFWISDQIIRNSPTMLTCVDPDPTYKTLLTSEVQQQYKNFDLFTGTATDFYNSAVRKEYDVVFCMGLLYHIHNPIDLFEKIINFTSPSIIIIETVLSKDTTGASLNMENINLPGNGFSDAGIKVKLPYNITLGHKEYIEVLKHGGYQCMNTLFYEDVNDPPVVHKSKKHAALMVFHRDTTEK